MKSTGNENGSEKKRPDLGFGFGWYVTEADGTRKLAELDDVHAALRKRVEAKETLFEIKHNNCVTRCPCRICGSCAGDGCNKVDEGPSIFWAGTRECVCWQCCAAVDWNLYVRFVYSRDAYQRYTLLESRSSSDPECIEAEAMLARWRQHESWDVPGAQVEPF